MKKRNIFAVSSMLALAVMGSGMLSSCTDDFDDLNTNKTQVDPGDLPFKAQSVSYTHLTLPTNREV